MPKVRITINANTLFPISDLKKHLKEAFTAAEKRGSAIITEKNRPAYALIRIDDNESNTYINNKELSEALAEQIARVRSDAKGKLTTEPNWWETP